MENWAEWKKPYVHGIILILPPKDIGSFVNPLREKYDPVSQSYCEAHISLTPPFRAQPSEQDWRALERVAQNFPCMDIALGPPNDWLHQSVIYLEVKPADALEKLRDALLETDLFGEPSFKSFVPHMTITEGLSGIPVTADLLATLQSTVPERSFRLDHLTHLKPDKSFCFKAERLLKLGAG